MESPLKITFRHMETSPALESIIREKVDNLERFFDGIIACHVVVETPHHHRQQGRHFHIEIDLTVPGAEIVVGRDPAPRKSHEDVHAALRDVFDAARRKLQDHAHRLRGDVKKHQAVS